MAGFLVDIVSDLHIDQWDNKIDNKYPCGLIGNCPYNFSTRTANILIVAGDLSDNIDISIEYLNRLSNNYDKILFVDGNHEHVHRYPSLFSIKEINEKVKKFNNDKLVYLPENDFILDGTVFIGACGWWDYNKKTNLENHIHYFKEWIPHFNKNDNLEFIDNVYKQSVEEGDILKEKIEKYNKDDTINNIILVTHTVPLKECCDQSHISESYETQLNSKLNMLVKEKNKISHWIFGHTHDHYEFFKHDIYFLCNPRGRPEDFNRENYNLKTVSLSKKSNL